MLLLLRLPRARPPHLHPRGIQQCPPAVFHVGRHLALPLHLRPPVLFSTTCPKKGSRQSKLKPAVVTSVCRRLRDCLNGCGSHSTCGPYPPLSEKLKFDPPHSLMSGRTSCDMTHHPITHSKKFGTFFLRGPDLFGLDCSSVVLF